MYVYGCVSLLAPECVYQCACVRVYVCVCRIVALNPLANEHKLRSTSSKRLQNWLISFHYANAVPPDLTREVFLLLQMLFKGMFSQNDGIKSSFFHSFPNNALDFQITPWSVIFLHTDNILLLKNDTNIH